MYFVLFLLFLQIVTKKIIDHLGYSILTPERVSLVNEVGKPIGVQKPICKYNIYFNIKKDKP